MNLLDTNIFLAILLDEEKSQNAEDFISDSDVNELFMIDFSLHSIGVILFSSRINRPDVLSEFVQDTIIEGGIRVIPLSPLDMPTVVEHSNQFSLDFDDAYQYSVCKKYNLEIVSFDSDFDRTDLQRIIP